MVDPVPNPQVGPTHVIISHREGSKLVSNGIVGVVSRERQTFGTMPVRRSDRVRDRYSKKPQGTHSK